MEEHGIILGREASGLGSPREIRSPYDSQVVGIAHFGDSSIVEQAIAAAAETFTRTSHAAAHERSQWLKRIADLIGTRKEQLAQTIAGEAGKPIRLARLEVDRAESTFRIASREALRLEGEIIPLDSVPSGEGRLGLVRRFPLGPVAAISPFNFPLNLVAHKVASALAAGNTVVLKPASQTPLSAIELGRVALEAGVPEGAFNVVPAPASEAFPLLDSEHTRVLSFTGSAEVGWHLKTRAPKKRVILELGGNAAAIVEPDAEVELAAKRLALGAFVYAGQICISVQRIYVQENIAPSFIEALIEATKKEITCGDPSDEGVLCGPMIDEANADRIMDWIEQAVEAGANLLLKPQRSGNVVSPAILSRVPKHLPVVTREAFGPVVVVESYRRFSDALQMVNDSRYGLQAAIFSNRVDRVLAAFKRLEVGGIIHNDYPTYRVDPMPYGGVKDSGVGREGPRYAIEEMTEMRLLVLKEER